MDRWVFLLVILHLSAFTGLVFVLSLDLANVLILESTKSGLLSWDAIDVAATSS